MGLYSRHVFPRLCDWSMRAPHIARLRRDVLAGANGEILEIGFGTGLNLEHYPVHVRHLTAVDPGVGMTRIARRRIEGSHIDVDLRVQTAEELPFEDGRFDCVVSTWTLCSIQDSARLLPILSPRVPVRTARSRGRAAIASSSPLWLQRAARRAALWRRS